MTTVNAANVASNRPDPKILRRLATTDILCLGTAALIAAIILCGWLVPAVGSVLPNGWTLMKVDTATATLLCVTSLTLTRRKHGPGLILVSRVCASVAILLAGTALLEHWSSRSIGLAILPGPMSIQSACCIVLLGLSSVIERTRQDLLGHALDALNATLAT